MVVATMPRVRQRDGSAERRARSLAKALAMKRKTASQPRRAANRRRWHAIVLAAALEARPHRRVATDGFPGHNRRVGEKPPDRPRPPHTALLQQPRPAQGLRREVPENSAELPHGIPEQSPTSQKGAVDTGGLGSGPGVRETAAVDWAESQEGSTAYAFYCSPSSKRPMEQTASTGRPGTPAGDWLDPQLRRERACWRAHLLRAEHRQPLRTRRHFNRQRRHDLCSQQRADDQRRCQPILEQPLPRLGAAACLLARSHPGAAGWQRPAAHKQRHPDHLASRRLNRKWNNRPHRRCGQRQSASPSSRITRPTRQARAPSDGTCSATPPRPPQAGLFRWIRRRSLTRATLRGGP